MPPLFFLLQVCFYLLFQFWKSHSLTAVLHQEALGTSTFMERVALQVTSEHGQNAQSHGEGMLCFVHKSNEECTWEKLPMPKLLPPLKTQKTFLNLK